MDYNHQFSRSAPNIIQPRTKRKRVRSFFSKFRKRKPKIEPSSRSQIQRTTSMFNFPVEKLYLTLYNLSRAESLSYNKRRGLLLEEIKWEVIRQVKSEWTADDIIWALGTDGSEYKCSCDLIGQNPIFRLLKSFMSRNTLNRHRTTVYKMYYLEDLLKVPNSPKENIWFLTKDPKTGAVLDIS